MKLLLLESNEKIEPDGSDPSGSIFPVAPMQGERAMAESEYNLPMRINNSEHFLIEHSVDGEVIPQRPTDGYINATRLLTLTCRICR